MAVLITRTGLSARELRAASAKTTDAKAARRMPVIAPVMDGADRQTTAESCGRGPDAGADGVVRWWRVDPKRRIEARFGVTMHERIAGKPLAGLGLRRLSVRPPHPKSDPEAEEAFKETSR